MKTRDSVIRWVGLCADGVIVPDLRIFAAGKGSANECHW